MKLRSAATDLWREWQLAIKASALSATLMVIGCLTLLASCAGWLRTSQRMERQQALERENSQQQYFLESAFLDDTLANPSDGELTPTEQERRRQLQMSARLPDLMRFSGGVWRSIMPTSLLTGLSMGASGEWPDHYLHAGSSKTQTLARAMRPNPLLAAVGAFDLTLLVGVIVPLAVIVLTFDVVAADREQGRWELVRSQATSLQRLIIARCLVRVAALALVVITLTGCCALIFPTGRTDVADLRNFAAWSVGVSAYLAFWTWLAICINSLQLSSTGAGLLLLLCWCLLVLAIPAAIERGINDSFPMAPQSELAGMEDDVRKQAEQEAELIWTEFLRQHPQVVLDEENPQQEQVLRDVALSRVIRSRVQARIDAYLQRFLDRETALDRLQLLTPLLAWRTASDQCAGTSLRHFVEFARQTALFHDDYVSYFEPMSLAGRELSLPDIQAIPRFDGRQVQARLPLTPLLLSAGTLFLWTAACGLLSWQCFRRGAIR